MNHEALDALEWPEWIDLTQALARTALGRERLESLRDPQGFSKTADLAQTLQQETREILPLLQKPALWTGMENLRDLSLPIERVQKGGILEVDDLVELRAWCFVLDSWLSFPRDGLGKHFLLMLTTLEDPTATLRILGRVLSPQGTISENASPKLSILTKDIRSLKKKIETTLQATLQAWGDQGFLQEKFSDVREGHYVIPVKISDKNKMDGEVFGVSASKSTAYIEPKEVAALNQNLRIKNAEYDEEVYRILRETAKELAPNLPDLEGSFVKVGYWDMVAAKGRISNRYGGQIIHVEAVSRDMVLPGTAHPMLWWSLDDAHIVRNTLELSEPRQMLLLTGPNTGGKTVLLKTIGFAALCARSGFSFPGHGQLRVPFFREIFADLGDPQSMEAHLSSFAGHLMRMKHVIENVTSQSLVLMDEMNSATDPEEGAALTRAFLESLFDQRKGLEYAVIIGTTHDPRLKGIGVEDSRVLNASIAFDEEGKKPLHRILLGTTGRSRALDTAARLGMPSIILDRARELLSDSHQRMENLLCKLEADASAQDQNRREAERLKADTEKDREVWIAKTEGTVEEALEKTRARWKRIVENAQIEIRESILKLHSARSTKEAEKIRGEMAASMEDIQRKLDSAFQDEAPGVAELLPSSRRPADIDAEKIRENLDVLSAGTWVRVPKWKNIGKIIEMQGNRLKVALGLPSAHSKSAGISNMTVSINIKDCEKLSPKELSQYPQIKVEKEATLSFRLSAGSPAGGGDAGSLDLRGQRFEEAMKQLEFFLDRAYLDKRPFVTIIHGLGTGALREGTRKLLKSRKNVANFRDGGEFGGGGGATVVEFDL